MDLVSVSEDGSDAGRAVGPTLGARTDLNVCTTEYFLSVVDRRENHIYLYCSLFCVKRSHLASRPFGSG